MLNSFIRHWADFVVNRRWVVIIFSLVLGGLSFLPLKNLYFDHSPDMWFHPADGDLKNYNALRDRFGSEQFIAIGIDARPGDKTVFSPGVLAEVGKLTGFLELQENVTKVSSLSNYQLLGRMGDSVVSGDLVPDVESLKADASAAESLERVMVGEQPAMDVLFTKDLQHTFIIGQTAFKKGTVEHHVKMVNDLRAFIEKEKFAERGFQVQMLGRPVISEAFFTLNMKDQGNLYPLMYLLVLIVLFLSFRSIPGIVLPLVMIAASTIIMFGFQGFFKWPFNVVNVTIPVLVMCIGIGDCVHILVWFYRYRNQGDSPKEAVRNAVVSLWVPCTLQSLTTAFGFVAVTLTHLPPLRQYGFIALAGVGVEFLLSTATLPAMLTFVHRLPRAAIKQSQGGIVHNLLENLAGFTYRNRKGLTAAGLAVAVVSGYFCMQLKAETNFLDILRKEEPLRKSFQYFDEAYHGLLNLEYMVDAKTPGGAYDPAFLSEVHGFQEYLETSGHTGKALSVLNPLRRVNQLMNGGDPAAYALPQSREAAEDYLNAYRKANPRNGLEEYITGDGRYLRISVRVRNLKTKDMKEFIEQIDAFLAKNHPGLSVEKGGALALFTKIDSFVLTGLVSSFSIAAGLIFVCFLFIFRSLKYSLAALIPSLVPVMVSGAIMQMLGLSLDSWTILIASITIGIAVDNTIHILLRYIWARKEGMSQVEAVHRSITQAGRAVIYTSVILTIGFSVLMIGSLLSTFYFGFFSALIMVLALAGSLVFLPAILYMIKDPFNARQKPKSAPQRSQRVADLVAGS